MRIAVPKEIKPREGRVALVPDACGELVRNGHEVFVEQGAGRQSGYFDQEYLQQGVVILPDAPSVYGRGELIVKVKEPLEPELGLLRSDQVLFGFLHLAANRSLMSRLLDIGITAVAFETLVEGGRMPILAPMSDIAGRLAIQIGAHLLHGPQGGKGLLLGGLPGAERGRVVILGGGSAGGNAARLAASIGANVTVFDRNRLKLESMRELGDNVTALYPYSDQVARAVETADLLVGAVLITGAVTPRLVSADQVAGMQPGSVIVDIAVDQGGCIETTRPTDYDNPTYVVDDVVHFAVTNMPGAVPRSASQALSAALMPYLTRLTDPDWRTDAVLAAAINVAEGQRIFPALKGL